MLVLSMPSPAAAQGPTLNVSAPTNDAAIDGNTVTVVFTASNIKIVPTSVAVEEAGRRPEANQPGEGHLHFVLDLQPLVVWEKLDAYTFTNVPPGEHQLMVEIVQNDHSSLSPPVMQHIRFRSGMPQARPVTAAGGMPDGVVGALIALGILLVLGGSLISCHAPPRRRRRRHGSRVSAPDVLAHPRTQPCRADAQRHDSSRI
jgi:hypothetical protein